MWYSGHTDFSSNFINHYYVLALQVLKMTISLLLIGVEEQ